MIDKVSIENYRSIAHADVELGPLTVLVGRNGAGKSTFIDAMRLIRDALHFNLGTAIDSRGGMESLCRWTPTGRSLDIGVQLHARWNDHEGELVLILARTPNTGYSVKREFAVVNYPPPGVFDGFIRKAAALIVGMDGNSYETITPGNQAEPDYGPGTEVLDVIDGKWRSGWPDIRAVEAADPLSLQLASQTGYNLGLSDLRKHLQRATFYTIFPNTLREPQKPSSDTILNEHGENLGTALRHIIGPMGPWRSDLVAAMQRLVGDVVDARVKSAGGYLVTELKHESHAKRDKWFNLSQESDGTLRMLGLLVAIYQDPPPSIIVIEEPELTIHPGALAILADILREASGRTQVLLTTQSPDLVSLFKADEIRVVERVDGVTEIGMIDETQRDAIEQHLFTGGELLRIEGLRRRESIGEPSRA